LDDDVVHDAWTQIDGGEQALQQFGLGDSHSTAGIDDQMSQLLGR
jgi:hypothetical protein